MCCFLGFEAANTASPPVDCELPRRQQPSCTFACSCCSKRVTMASSDYQIHYFERRCEPCVHQSLARCEYDALPVTRAHLRGCMPPAADQNNLYVTLLNISVRILSWKRRASVRLKLCPGPNPVVNRMFLNVTPNIHTNALNITNYHFEHKTAFFGFKWFLYDVSIMGLKLWAQLVRHSVPIPTFHRIEL
jgi:hypothetical protein